MLQRASEGGHRGLERALVAEGRALLRVAAATLVEITDDGEARLVAADPPSSAAHERRDGVAPAALRELVRCRLSTSLLEGSAAREVGALTDRDHGAEVALLGSIAWESGRRYVLALVDSAPNRFGKDEIELVRALTLAAAAAGAQLQRSDEHAVAVARQAALTRAAETLNASLDLHEVLARMCREAADILHADVAALHLRDPATGDLVVEATHNLPPEAQGYRVRAGSGLVGQAAIWNRPMLTNEHPRVAEDDPASPFRGLQSSVAAPMHWDGEVRGLISVGYANPFLVTEDELGLLKAFAELAAVALRNASAHAGLAHAAVTDSLTGCLNHAAFKQALEREVERAQRTGQPLSLVLLDLDGFKQVNERHGHLVGDELLRRVGQGLRHAVRPYDVVARYGGDEFAILTTEAEEAMGVEIARRALDRLGQSIGDARQSTRVASAGVAQWSPGLAPEGLIELADRALLFGKHQGVDGVTVAASSLPRQARELTASRRVVPSASRARPALWSDGARAQARRLSKRTRQLVLANALGARLSAMTDVGAIITAAVEELHHAFGYFLCAVVRIRDDGIVETVAGRGRAFEDLAGRGWSQPLEHGLIGRCLAQRRPVLVNDVLADPDYTAIPETAASRAELVTPLWVGEELWGAINLEDSQVDAFDDEDVRLVQTIADQVGSAMRSALLYEQLERAYLGTAEALSAALEEKDSYTASHARSIVANAEAVGRRLGMRDDDLRDLRYAAAFHDIGKITLPEAILNKRGPLTAEERVIVERHTVVGEQILAPIDFLTRVAPLVRHEHERWDGGGYPDGLVGDEIPLASRIVLACDAYHAMTSDRPYRAAMSAEIAREELGRNAGSQFDPDVVDALLAVLDEQAAQAQPESPAPRSAATDAR